MVVIKVVVNDSKVETLEGVVVEPKHKMKMCYTQ